MSPAMLSPAVVKEVRALLPTWLASAAAVFAAAVVQEVGYSRLPSFAFAIGMLALGAQSVGHEYTHRTLPVLLSLPSDRRRLLVKKLAVLIVMLLTLSALAWLMLFRDPEFVRRLRVDPRVLVVALVAAFFLAPWLTMICRNTLAGIVFSITVPALLLIAGDLIGLAMYGVGGGALIDNFKFAFFWRGLIIVCAVAAVSSWRMFGRLEAIDGPSADIQAPEWLVGDVSTRKLMPLRRQHPYWLLAKKELRLQQMTFVVVVIFTAAWAGLTVLARLTEHLPLIPIDAIAVLYFAILTILIGSLASAEERQLGTLEWQTLLPIASWKQWLIKMAIVFGLALLLGILLAEIVMVRFHRPMEILSRGGFIFLVTSISLYVSSLSTSGVKAVVLALPATIGLIAFFNLLTSIAYRSGVRIPLGFINNPLPAVTLVAGFIAVTLRYAYVNHRSGERNGRRVLIQTGVLTAYLVIALVGIALL
jgi:hypothetical protein